MSTCVAFKRAGLLLKHKPNSSASLLLLSSSSSRANSQSRRAGLAETSALIAIFLSFFQSKIRKLCDDMVKWQSDMEKTLAEFSCDGRAEQVRETRDKDHKVDKPRVDITASFAKLDEDFIQEARVFQAETEVRSPELQAKLKAARQARVFRAESEERSCELQAKLKAARKAVIHKASAKRQMGKPAMPSSEMLGQRGL